MNRRLAPLLAVPLAVILAACGAAAPSVQPTSVGAPPAEATALGTALKIGETAWITRDSSDGAGELIGTTVRQVSAIDPASIKGFSDDAKLSGFTPYAVVVQYDWAAASEFDKTLRDVPVLPITADGEIAKWLANDMGNVAMGDADACGLTLPEPTAGTALTCFVALSDGAEVVGAEYNGTSRGDFSIDKTHPYAQQPITWRP